MLFHWIGGVLVTWLGWVATVRAATDLDMYPWLKVRKDVI